MPHPLVPARADVVIHGGGIIARSFAHHLAKLGLRDVVPQLRHAHADRTRALLQQLSGADLGDAAFPFCSSQE